MNSITQYIKDREEDFKDKFGITYPFDKPSEIEIHISQTIKGLISKIIEENKPVKFNPNTDRRILLDPSAVDGYNLAIEDINNSLKEIL